MTAAIEMDEPEYHAHPALSQSLAKLLLPPSVPAKFKWAREHPQPPRKAFDFGHAAHALVLGVGAPIEVIQVTAKDGTKSDAPNRMTNSAKEHEKEIRAAGSVPLLREDYETVQAMAEALRSNPTAMALLSHGAAEKSVFWTDERGIERRCRYDYIPALSVPAIVDYKSTVDASKREFGRSTYKFGYDIQDAWYREAAEAIGLGEVSFAFVAQEKTPPYLAAVYELDERAREIGRRRVARALDIYQQCTEANDWPGYSTDIQPLSLPSWATGEDDAA